MTGLQDTLRPVYVLKIRYCMTVFKPYDLVVTRLYNLGIMT